jgi:hypothetical protein
MLDIHRHVFDDCGARDDAAYDEVVEGVLDLFVQSPEGQEVHKHLGHCGHRAALFLDYYLNHIGSSIAEIQLGDVREVLLDLFPRKVSVEADAAPEIVQEIRAFWAFLGREFALPQAGRIQEFLDDQAALKLKNLLADPRNYGMAKSFFMAGRQAGYDMTTEEGSAAFMAIYNASLANEAAPAALAPFVPFANPIRDVPVVLRIVGPIQPTSSREHRKKRKAQRQAKKRNRR